MNLARALTGVSSDDSNLSQLSQPAVQLSIPSEVPQPSQSALNFLKDLQPADFKYVLFDDKLDTIAGAKREIGQYEMKVREDQWNEFKCYHVNASSEGRIDGVLCGTTLDSYVTESLETLYQEKSEFIKLENCPLDRLTVIKRTEKGYDVTKDIQQGGKKEHFNRLFDFGLFEGFISEGANLLLQRLLITKTFPEGLEFVSFDSDSNICLSTYTDLSDIKIAVDDRRISVLGIQRTIHSIKDVSASWQTYYMKDGHLISRVQVGSPVHMKVSNVPELIMPDEYLAKLQFPRKPIDIDEDMQLNSKFLERKEEIKCENVEYIRDHPELNMILSDFMKQILIRKPDNVYEYAGHFFKTFNNREETTTFLNSAENTFIQ